MSHGPSRRDLFRGLFTRKSKQPAEPLVGLVRTASEVVDQHTHGVPGKSDDQSKTQSPGRFGRGLPLPVHRPPGAVEESEFLAGCTRCNECLKACPHDSIVLAPIRLREAAGTPIIDPTTAPCRMCTDRSCAVVCEPKVLRLDFPAKMGVAAISPITCLAHRNSPCSTCVEQCPVEGAIEVHQGRPSINADICTGCGVCLYVCPAPQNAVMILPVKVRPKSIPTSKEIP